MNKDITILLVDNGNAKVVLDTKTYEEKAQDLPCQSPFKKLTRDPTLKNERKVNSTLKT